MQQGRNAQGQHLRREQATFWRFFFIWILFSFSPHGASPKEAEEGGESVGEAAHPLHDLGDDDLVTVRARQLHGILAQELHGDDEAAARAAVAPKAAASTRI